LHIHSELRRVLGEDRRAANAVVALGIAAALCEVAGLGLIVPLADQLLGTGLDRDGTLLGILDRLANGFGGGALGPACAIFLLIFAKSALTYAASVWGAAVRTRSTHRLRMRASNYVMSMPYSQFNALPRGTLLQSLTGENWRLGEAIDVHLRIAIQVGTVMVFVTFLLLVSWPLTLFALVGAVVVSVLLRTIVRSAVRRGRSAARAHEQLTEALLDVLSGMRTVRSFAREDSALQRVSDESSATVRQFFAVERLSALAAPTVEALNLMLFLGVLAISNALGVGVATAMVCVLMLLRALPYARDLSNLRVRLAGLVGGIEAARAFDLPPPPPRRGRLFSGLRQEILFEDVSFHYPSADSESGTHKKTPALDRVRFTIQRNRITAIVGRSGAGKSTIIQLLFGLHEPDSGRILVDGTPLNKLDSVSWRRRLAWAGQEATLFAGSIRDNIAFACPTATDAEVEAAARLADAHEFIAALPAGYATMLVRDGGLSGGQRQRLTLARALLSRPDILVLDEATNEVDAMSELAVRKVLEELRASMTIVVVAHRLRTVETADDAVVLDEGRVVETGPVPELLVQRSWFAELFTPAGAGRASSGAAGAEIG